jgi:hypothetical protein
MAAPHANLLSPQGHAETHITLIGLRTLRHRPEPNQLHHHEGIVPLLEKIGHQKRLHLGFSLDPLHYLARDLDAQCRPFVRDAKVRREGEVEGVSLNGIFVDVNADVELGGFRIGLLEGPLRHTVRDLVGDAEGLPCAGRKLGAIMSTAKRRLLFFPRD